MTDKITIQDYIANSAQFSRISKDYECEVPKGNCWCITIRHDATQRIFQYFEEDNYYSLADQIAESDPDWREIINGQ